MDFITAYRTQNETMIYLRFVRFPLRAFVAIIIFAFARTRKRLIFLRHSIPRIIRLHLTQTLRFEIIGAQGKRKKKPRRVNLTATGVWVCLQPVDRQRNIGRSSEEL